MRLIGVLMAYAQSDSTAQSWLAAFRAALSKLGWTEGNNLRIELRWSADNVDRMKALAKELVDLRPNAIFGVTTPVVGALARETKTIPIVFAGVSDPIGSLSILTHQRHRAHKSAVVHNAASFRAVW
jgi:putative ABC transport system substrate-binding protein